MNDLDYDGRHEYRRPPAAPKPPPELWAEMEAAGREAGTAFEASPRYMAAHARYRAWLADQDIEGHPDPFHGHPPTEIDDDERELF